jgi:hypothetical protein
MIRHLVLEPETAEPTVGEVEMHLLAQAPFGPKPHDIANDQHPDHEAGIDRGASSVTVETAHLFVQVIQIKDPINPSKKMTGGDMRLKIELIEQPGMNLLRSKHRKPSKSP